MPTFRRDTVAIGASAGGVEALRTLMAALPPDFPAAVLVVMHFPAGGTSALPAILDRAGPLRAVRATDGMPLEPGVVYVASPNRHLLISDHLAQLAAGPTEDGYRPSINATFRSTAVTAGPSAVGVVLSGSLSDGADGLRAIVERGGTAIVQDPEDALYDGMPNSALRATGTPNVFPISELGAELDRLVREPHVLDAEPEVSSALALEDKIARNGRTITDSDVDRFGTLTGYTCPDCHGPLIEIGGGHQHFRCRVGHGWSAEALLAAQDIQVQRALWTSLRALDEKARLADKIGQELDDRGAVLGNRYSHTARECRDAAEVLRKFLTTLDEPS